MTADDMVCRAKRKDNGEWVEGYYVKCRKYHYILESLTAEFGWDERYADFVEIDHTTLCRYTGEKMVDNGERIFEGHIVSGKFKVYRKDNYKWESPQLITDGTLNGKVVFNRGKFTVILEPTINDFHYVDITPASTGFVSKAISDDTWHEPLHFSYRYDWRDIKVVGNVFDNPGLFKEQCHE